MHVRKDSNSKTRAKHFAKHERLGPLEQLKAASKELDNLSFVKAMKDDDGITTYTGYLNRDGKR